LALHSCNKVQERFSKVETQQFQVAECQQKVMELWIKGRCCGIIYLHHWVNPRNLCFSGILLRA